MKGIILAAGKGSRLSQTISKKNKSLIEVHGKSLIRRNIENICALNEITECIVVVGHGAEEIMREVGNICNNKKIIYCIQREQKGLIDALQSAVYHLEGDDFFMVLGDEMIVNNNYMESIQKFQKSNNLCHVGIIHALDKESVKKTYTFKLDQNGNLSSFIEKPLSPYNLYMGTGNIFLKGSVLYMLDEVPINPERGERELVGLLNLILESNNEIPHFIVGDNYFNVNTKHDMELLEKYINLTKKRRKC